MARTQRTLIRVSNKMNFELDCERRRPATNPLRGSVPGREAEGDTGRSTVEAEQRSSRPAAAARQPEGILLGALNTQRDRTAFLANVKSALAREGLVEAITM